MSRRRVRVIAYDPALVPEGGLEVVAGNAPLAQLHKAEPAGIRFHEAALAQSGFLKQEVEEKVSEDKAEKESDVRWEGQRGRRKKKDGEKGGEVEDYYALLGLSHLRYLATDDQIRKAYREAALKHHPDKQAAALAEAGEAAKEEAETLFKAVQTAYEVLSDPVRRRVYDSTDEFDDDVPVDCAPGDFFRVFVPAFHRNARWSNVQPVPELGEEASSYDDVDKFYDFWYAFKSWREFPNEEDFDLEQAESREHKRWMERQNAKLREKAKKEEYARLRSLVETAYRLDPRIQRRKDEEKAERLRKKQAKVDAKRKAAEELVRAEREEQERRDEAERLRALEAAANKKQREKDKKALRRERARLRSLHAEAPQNSGPSVSLEALEDLCTAMDIDGLRWLCDSATTNPQQTLTLIQSAIENPQQPPPSSSAEAAAAAAGTTAAAGPKENGREVPSSDVPQPAEPSLSEAQANGDTAHTKPWTREDHMLLHKAMLKFPRGTRQRWEVVAQYISRGVDEVLAMVKLGIADIKPTDASAFDKFLQDRKPGAAAPIASPLSERVEVEVASMAQEEQPTSTPEPSSKATASAPVSDWSEAQELALVKAIKAFPKETPQRWDRIAQAVPGKTKAQCFKRFSDLREGFRAKKGDAS
eukprot:jgi/Chlat1/4265/Chrsp29S04369